MAVGGFYRCLAVTFCLISYVNAQEEIETCYGPGSIVGAIIGTLLITIALFATSVLLYKMYWRSRKGKHLVLVADAENPGDQYAFDNPCFREATPIKHNIHDEKNSSKLDKNRWLGWNPLNPFGGQKNEKVTSLDDSYINDSHLKVVTLKSHDFTGLGFNICGNMRDGIFVKDVLHRGPAFESGCINSGDRIDSVCISFRNMVFEDALTILSYASPYEVQVQVENDSYSRPSTLIRSKRESNAVSSAERIRHPKYNRSQSISHLAEIGKSNNKRPSHQMSFTSEKNRINQSLNKSQEYQGHDYPTLKLTSSLNEPKKETQKLEKSAAAKTSPVHVKTSPSPSSEPNDSQNKFHKFGIKVLPISINPKMGIQSVTGAKKTKEQLKTVQNQNETNEKMESEEKKDEIDGNKENVKTIITKGFQNLKDKINQNTLGKKKKEEGSSPETSTAEEAPKEVPVPKARSNVACGVKALEQNQQTCSNIPEEVTRAGDVARNNRKSAGDITAMPRRSVTNLVIEPEPEKKKSESSSECSSDRDSPRNGVKRPTRSKGKAPAPPKMDEIKKEEDSEKNNIFEPDAKPEGSETKSISYDSDSDTEGKNPNSKNSSNGTKIELNATQVTIHHSQMSDNINDEEIETSRKAASLGDLSKLDSENTLSMVLERAVSLDLADGSSQCGKKRKAPLPPPEEFPAVFDEGGYRKEPRLENSLGLNTFQRRLKKSSDFGTMEDAMQDGPKSLEIEVKDISETNNSNIQEFSTWLEGCRRPKESNSTSLVNVNEDMQYNVKFSVNQETDHRNFPGAVIVISQPNSIDITESAETTEFVTANESTIESNMEEEDDETPPKLPTTPMPTMSSPLSSSLTYITEIKVSTSEQETLTDFNSEQSPSLSSDSMTNDDDREVENIVSSTPIKRTDIVKMLSERNLESITVNHQNPEEPNRRASDSETSKIPIRTMKSETGQKVLATIQSLAAKESASKTPEIEYAKRVASLFSSASPVSKNRKSTENTQPNISAFYLKTNSTPKKENRKVPPVVPPRKQDTTLSSKSTVTVELPVSQTHITDNSDRNVVSFSSFMPRSKEEDRIASWDDNMTKEHGGMNGGHMQMQTGIVNLPVKTSATKIVFENKEVDNEEF